MSADYFGFRSSPFSASDNPNALYFSEACERTYAAILGGVRERTPVILLTGSAGSGKTTLMNRLAADLRADTRSVQLNGNDFSDPSSSSNGQDTAERNRRKIQVITDFLIAQAQSGGNTALLFDDAHLLDEPILFALLPLLDSHQQDRAGVPVVLFGSELLRDNLRLPGLEAFLSEVTVDCELDKLSDDDVASYVQKRLHAAGYEGEQLFSDSAVKKLAHYSDGRPRLINVVGEMALLHAHLDKADAVSEQVVDKAASVALRQVTSEPDQTLAIDPGVSGEHEQGPSTQLFSVSPAEIQQDRDLKAQHVSERDQREVEEDEVEELFESEGVESVFESRDPFSGVYEDGEDDDYEEDYEAEDDYNDEPATEDKEEEASWDENEQEEYDGDDAIREFPEEDEPATEFVYDDAEAADEEATIASGGIVWKEESLRDEETAATQAIDSTSGEIEQIVMSSDEAGTHPSAFHQGFFSDPDAADANDTGSLDADYVRQSVSDAQSEELVESPSQFENDYVAAPRRPVWPLAIAAGVLILVLLGGGGFLLNQELGFMRGSDSEPGGPAALIEESPASVTKPDSASAASVESRPTEKPRVGSEALRIPSLDDALDSEPSTGEEVQGGVPVPATHAQAENAEPPVAEAAATESKPVIAFVEGDASDDEPLFNEEEGVVIEPQQARDESLTGQALIDSLLAEAERQYNNKKLTTPENDNAFATYQRILELEADNEQALTGVRKIKQRYKNWAETAFEEGDFTNAREFYRRALIVDPHDVVMRAALANLRAREAVRGGDSNRKQKDSDRGSLGPLQPLIDNLRSQNQ